LVIWSRGLAVATLQDSYFVKQYSNRLILLIFPFNLIFRQLYYFLFGKAFRLTHIVRILGFFFGYYMICPFDFIISTRFIIYIIFCILGGFSN